MNHGARPMRVGGTRQWILFDQTEMKLRLERWKDGWSRI